MFKLFDDRDLVDFYMLYEVLVLVLKDNIEDIDFEIVKCSVRLFL